MFGARLYGTNGGGFRTQAQPQTQSPDKKFDAVVYPNPTNGTLYVKLDGEFDKENTVIEIMDGRGMIVHKENIGKTQNDFAQLDMKMYANGVYLVRITSGANVVYRKISLVK
jgi:hypothetical protein